MGLDAQLTTTTGKATAALSSEGWAGALLRAVLKILLPIAVAWFKNKLSANERRLNKERAKHELEKLELRKAETEKMFGDTVDQLDKAKETLQLQRQTLEQREKALAEAEVKHRERVARVVTLSDWDALNKLAGVK